MNIQSFKKLPIGAIRYFDTIGSTNDEALAWAAQGAPNLSIVIADEQTAGRGRLDRKWFTPPRSAIACSVIMHPTSSAHLSRTVGLAALSIADACSRQGLTPQIKWPNDILINGKKTAGILIESAWMGDKVTALVIGMGINILKESIPPAEDLKFSATSIESELGHAPDREEFLRTVLTSMVKRLPQMGTDEFLASWEAQLAYRNQIVQISEGNKIIQGRLLGLQTDGGLRLLHGEDDSELTVHFGDVSLRPLT
jgi:BirA family transcriptional regulator, biotin operon repressor / biotin---[acetyl-CoA-carboxylase] ligase